MQVRSYLPWVRMWGGYNMSSLSQIEMWIMFLIITNNQFPIISSSCWKAFRTGRFWLSRVFRSCLSKTCMRLLTGQIFLLLKKKFVLKSNSACEYASSANPVTETKRVEQPQFHVNTQTHCTLLSLSSIHFLKCNFFTTHSMFILNEMQG